MIEITHTHVCSTFQAQKNVMFLSNSPAGYGSCYSVKACISNLDHGLNDFYSAINVRAWYTGGCVCVCVSMCM